VSEATVGTPHPEGGSRLNYATEAEKQAEEMKRFNDVVARYSGSTEATVAASFLGAIYADQGKLKEAEQQFKQVVASGDRELASTANLSLAQIYIATGRTAEGEAVLRALLSSPTALVSKEQATLALARAIAKTRPAEARKRLEPLQKERPAVSQAAISAISELPAQ
ncbi:MAG: tetratricopeptide repeat protein, partial [Bryobacteraceae bacterium]